MFYHLCLLITLILSSWGLPLARRNNGESTVALPTGRYRGLHDGNASTTVYYGIPYAHSSRFGAPQPVESVENKRETIDATAHGPACINFNLPPPYDKSFEVLLGTKPLEPQSEDCLTMDVYVPDCDQDEPLPVLLFTHGGGFLVGSSWVYDMRPMVSAAAAIGEPFIGVSFNYRLGPLGSLNPSTAKSTEINVGVSDQIEALRYVQNHIDAFGGDPSKVTIMGQSAGAESIMHQFLFSNENLFRAAWFASVPSSGAPFLQTQPESKDRLVQSYAQSCGCPANQTIESTVDCLRRTDVRKLVQVSADWEGSGLGLGGPVKENVFRAVRSGQYPHVPVFLSSCRDEGTNSATGFNATDDAVTATAVQTLTNTAARFSQEESEAITSRFLETYPNDPAQGCPYDGANTTYGQSEQFKRFSAITTDAMYTEAWTEYLDQFSRHADTWGLLFEEPIPGAEAALGVQHGSDLIFYFPTLLTDAEDPRLNGKGEFTAQLHTALAHFVSHMDPNGKGDSDYTWPRFNQGQTVTSASSQAGLQTVPLPHREGFDLIRQTYRPDGF